jgi:diketogulonate reductase-like aldo/keto reductase
MRINLGLGYVLDRYPRFVRSLAGRALGLFGWEWLDTAYQYGEGNCEYQAGKFFGKAEKIVIKIGLGYGLIADDANRWQNEFHEDRIRELVIDSLSRTRRTRADCLLLHCPGKNSYLEPHIRVMEALKNEGLVTKVGVSIDRLEDMPKENSWVEAIQIPVRLVERFKHVRFDVVFLTGVGKTKASLKDLIIALTGAPWPEVVLLVGSKWPHRQLWTGFKARTLERHFEIIRS